MKLLANWYDYPQYYDLAFRSERQLEVDFIAAACRKYCDFPVRRLLEPACGTGRVLIGLADHGFRMTGFDLSRPALGYLRRRLTRKRLTATLFAGDMADFRLRRPVDAAYSTLDSFRHLVDEDSARRHLQCVAEAIRPGGIYILGFHLLPPDAAEECIERWSEQSGPARLWATLRVLQSNRRRRIERLRISLLVRKSGQELRLRHDFPLRMYTAAQFRRLLAKVPRLKLCDVYDYWYEIEHPLRLSNELSDTVFVLKRD